MSRYVTGGPRFRQWVKRTCVHTKAHWYGQPLDFDKEPWQREFLDEALLYDTTTGLRVYRTVVLGMPTKNGKSAMAGAFSVDGLLNDRDLAGRVEMAPLVLNAANSKDQAHLVFDQVKEFVRESPILKRHLVAHAQHIWAPRTKGTLRVVASIASKQMGMFPSRVVVDELGSAANRKLLTTLRKSALTRRQPLTTIISHHGFEVDSPLVDLYEDAVSRPSVEVRTDPHAVTIVRDRANGFLMWWYGIQEGMDPEDPDTWRRCNPASYVTDEQLRQAFHDPATGTLDDWIRFHLNGTAAGEGAFLEPGVWAGCKVPDLSLPSDEPAFLGLDASTKYDASALVANVPYVDGDRLVHRLKARILVNDSVTTLKERLKMAVREACQEYNVREVHYDPWRFDSEAEDLRSEGIEMVEFPQSHARMVPASQHFYEAAHDRRLEHDGDRLFAKHVGHTVARTTERGWRVDKMKSTHHVDACVGAVMAVEAAHNHFTVSSPAFVFSVD